MKEKELGKPKRKRKLAKKKEPVFSTNLMFVSDITDYPIFEKNKFKYYIQ